MGDLVETLLGGAGWGLGIGAAVGALSIVGGGLRPVAKQAIKLGMAAGDRLQEWTAEMREQMDDLVAEASSERAAEQNQATIVGADGEPIGSHAKQAAGEESSDVRGRS